MYMRVLSKIIQITLASVLTILLPNMIVFFCYRRFLCEKLATYILINSVNQTISRTLPRNSHDLKLLIIFLTHN